MQQTRRSALRPLLGALLVLTAASAARAQQPATAPAAAAPSDSVFRRAQRLVSAGDGAAGRAVVDSALAAAPAGSTEYAEALWWRASLASAAADAERDYRRLAVEFPLSPRAEDAMLRLAQLELARGDRAMAVKHLERLTLEHPTGASRPRASYWMARVLFEMNDMTGGCAAIAGARALVPPSDIELRNQIEYTARRCARYEAQRVSDSAAAAAAGPGSVAGVAAATPPVASSAPASARAATPNPVTTPATTPAPGRDTTPSRVAPPEVRPAPAAAAAAATRAPAPARPATRTTWGVQVAAFDTKGPADALVAKLGRGGFTAHVSGHAAPYRVRVGRLATRADAVKLQQRLKTRKIDGFVVSEESPR